mmetsp:Transcript_8763/g.14584  ORF Transcript_8763/g.14584 Transcript_8763/m.14584 type:complete len:240 (-) Transcript_8763:1075-1794(-)
MLLSTDAPSTDNHFLLLCLLLLCLLCLLWWRLHTCWGRGRRNTHAGRHVVLLQPQHFHQLLHILHRHRLEHLLELVDTTQRLVGDVLDLRAGQVLHPELVRGTLRAELVQQCAFRRLHGVTHDAKGSPQRSERFFAGPHGRLYLRRRGGHGDQIPATQQDLLSLQLKTGIVRQLALLPHDGEQSAVRHFLQNEQCRMAEQRMSTAIRVFLVRITIRIRKHLTDAATVAEKAPAIWCRTC